MSTYFAGGPIYDETTKSWQKTYLVQEGGKLLVESPSEYPVAQLAGPDKYKSKQARMALESITQAAGKQQESSGFQSVPAGASLSNSCPPTNLAITV